MSANGLCGQECSITEQVIWENCTFTNSKHFSSEKRGKCLISHFSFVQYIMLHLYIVSNGAKGFVLLNKQKL